VTPADAELRADIQRILDAGLGPLTVDALVGLIARLLPHGEIPVANGARPETVDVPYVMAGLKLGKSATYDLVARELIPGRLDLGSSTVRFAKSVVDAWLAGRAREEPKNSIGPKRQRGGAR